MNNVAVVLIAKAPVSGAVKTRFCPPCSPDQAAELAGAFLEDTASVASSMSGSVDVWCAYLGDPGLLGSILPEPVQLIPQRGSHFDERLANAADDMFGRGYERVVLLGADCPTVDSKYLSEAIVALDSTHVVLGPADDGGYVLIGLRQPEDRLFIGIEMGTERVAAETLERVGDLGLSVRVLPSLHDLDTVDELVAAWRAKQLDHAVKTRALVAEAGWFVGAQS